jgi:hypothetical protein
VSWIISEQSTALAEATTVLGLNPILPADRAVSDATAFKANNLRFLFCSQSHITDPYQCQKSSSYGGVWSYPSYPVVGA